jgi:hypothetical protein
MNSVTAALCKKPAIGLAMWLASLCATNQLLENTFVNLQSTDIILFQDIDVRMDDDYRMLMLLRPSSEPQLQPPGRASWSDVICPISLENPSPSAVDSSRPSTIFLKIEVLSTKGIVLTEQEFSPMCPRSKNENFDSLYLGSIGLKQGKYKLRLHNLKPLASGVAHRVQVLLMGQGVGFP